MMATEAASVILVRAARYRDLPIADRFDKIMDVWSDLCGCDEHTPAGQRPSFANAMYVCACVSAR